MCHEKCRHADEADEADIESFSGRDSSGIPLGLEIRLDSGLSSKALLKVIRRLVRAGGLYQRALAYYVLLFFRRGEHRLYGCSDFHDCAVTKLGLTDDYAKELIRVGRSFLPPFRAARNDPRKSGISFSPRLQGA